MTAPAGWHPDPENPHQDRYWDGSQWGATRPHEGLAVPVYRGPAKTAHGAGYWIVVGWWWEPVKWLGRVALWVIFLPVGIWRSVRHSRKNREARERRGWT